MLRKSICVALLFFMMTISLAGCQSDATYTPAGEAASTGGGQGARVTQGPHPHTESAPPTGVPTAPTTAVYGAGPPAGPALASQPISSPAPTAVSQTPSPTADPTPAPTRDPTPTVIRVSRSSITRDESPKADTSKVAALVGGNTAFALDLYQAIQGSDGNLFISPYSISLALAMAYAGSRGDTQRQMAETLHFDLPQGQLHSAFNALDLSLTGQSGEEDEGEFRLSIANSVWGQEGYGFLPEYLDTLALNYGDEVRPLDFRRNPEGARDRINDWVAGETQDRIKDLIVPGAITPLTRLVLANAIYFKAGWQDSFDENATRDRPFHLLDGDQRDVPMMRQQKQLRYARGDGYQAVELPYEGGEVAMAILLPDSGRFSEFEGSISGESLEAIVDGLDYELVRLTMPKFEMESAFSLSETLAAMGMPDPFDDQAANFSAMDGRSCQARGDICLVISDLLHKAFVSVDEAGTEAAAATAVVVGVTRAEPVEPEPIELVVDRPFLFIIRHLDTGAILFVGRVLSP